MNQLSVILPAYNEVDNIRECLSGLLNVLSQGNMPFEVIVVDDGSDDGTDKVAKEFSGVHPQVNVISHQRNLGKTEAIKSGLAKSEGNIVILMDTDLQYDPKDIPRLVDSLLQGQDAVNGYRAKREDGLSKTIPSKIFNWVTRLTFDLDIKDSNSGLKAFKKEALNDLDLKGDYHRYLLAAVKSNGGEVAEIPIAHYQRRNGKSKYGLMRIILGNADLLSLKLESALSKRPMLLFGSLSAACMLIGLTAGFYSILTGGVSLRPAVLLSIGFVLASIQFLSIGFLAELVLTVKEQVKRPRG